MGGPSQAEKYAAAGGAATGRDVNTLQGTAADRKWQYPDGSGPMFVIPNTAGGGGPGCYRIATAGISNVYLLYSKDFTITASVPGYYTQAFSFRASSGAGAGAIPSLTQISGFGSPLIINDVVLSTDGGGANIGLDVCTTSTNTANAIQMVVTGTGIFTPETTFPVGATPYSIQTNFVPSGALANYSQTLTGGVGWYNLFTEAGNCGGFCLKGNFTVQIYTPLLGTQDSVFTADCNTSGCTVGQIWSTSPGLITQIRGSWDSVGGHVHFDAYDAFSATYPLTLTGNLFGQYTVNPSPTVGATVLGSGSMTYSLVSGSAGAGANIGNYFYADQYAGADASVKINACITAVIAAGGGTCDARNLYGTQTMSTQINVGGGSGNLVTANGNLLLLLPEQAVWNWTITDGTSCGIMQYTNTTILGVAPGGGWAGVYLGAASSATNMDSLYCTQPSPTELGNNLSNVRAEGFVAENFNAGTFANGLIHIQSVSDQSLFSRIGALNWTGDAWHVQNVCCATQIDSSFGDSGQPGSAQNGGNVLTINGAGNGGDDLIISNSSFNGPGVGHYNVYYAPTANTFSTKFNSDYFEKYGTDTATAMIYVGANAANTQFSGGHAVNNCGSSCSQYLIENHSTQGLSVKRFGYGYFSTSGINDIANSTTFATDGFSINEYSVGNTGSGNSFFQRLQTGSLASVGPSPTLAVTTGTATLATGSTNVSGVINSTTTGTLAFNFTWNDGTGGIALYGHRAVCRFTDETTSADIITTTSATTTQLFASGTTASGDVISYLCSGY